jgi:hypothetical protein
MKMKGLKHHKRTFGQSTIKHLIKPSPAGHHANFKKILPSAMAKLIAEGLFVVDDTIEGGYRITQKGREKLADLQNE